MARKALTSSLIAKYLPYVQGNLEILDVGCGDSPYKSDFGPGRYTGIDVEVSGRRSENKKPTDWFDGVNIPFESDSFSFLIATEVLEHAVKPYVLFREMVRCTSPGGIILITIPMTWGLHEEPYDFMRLTPYGVERLGVDAGLEVLEVSSHVTGLAALKKLALSELNRKFQGKTRSKIAEVIVGLSFDALAHVVPDFSESLILTVAGVFRKPAAPSSGGIWSEN